MVREGLQQLLMVATVFLAHFLHFLPEFIAHFPHFPPELLAHFLVVLGVFSSQLVKPPFKVVYTTNELPQPQMHSANQS